MKWKNKGHEFDQKAKEFFGKEEIYIYGAGECGRKLYALLDCLNIKSVFVDGNRKKQLDGWMGQTVLSPMQLFQMDDKKNVVIAAMPRYIGEIRKMLENNGYIAEQHFWEMEEFCQFILPVYMVYIKDKLYMDSIGFLSTTVCNLKCEACLNFTPYNKKQKHMALEDAKRTLDAFFKVIDYVRLFSYTGGEPLLYPYIDELLDYIGEHYREKIHTIGMSTNCTLIPKDTTCVILKKYNMEVYIDDYSKYVNKSKEVLPRLKEKLDSYGIPYVVNCGETGYWIDLAPNITNNSMLTEDELIEYKDRCAVPYHDLRDGRIYSCNYASFAMKAGLQEDSPNDYFELSNYDEKNKRELLEFILGYTEKGYVDFCKHCAGFLPINPYKKPVGRQVDQK